MTTQITAVNKATMKDGHCSVTRTKKLVIVLSLSLLLDKPLGINANF